MHDLLAVIMIGGGSSRMGIPKHLLRFKGQSLLDRTIDQVSVLGIQCAVSCREGQLPDPYPIPKLIDLPTGHGGPMNALMAAKSTFADKNILLLSIDMPRIDTSVIAQLIEAYSHEYEFTGFENKSSCLIEPFPAIYHRSVSLSSLTEYHSLFALIKTLQRKTILKLDSDSLININTPEIWADFLNQ